MLQASRQLYGETEVRRKGDKNEDAMKQMSGQTHESQVCKNHNEDWQVGDEAPEEDEKNEGLGQTRGQGITEQGRYRITFEACQEIYDFFQGPEVEPKGCIGKSKLVVPGAHACLSNISDEHTIIRDEAFVYNGKETVRKAGQKVPNLIRAWVILRRDNALVRCISSHQPLLSA